VDAADLGVAMTFRIEPLDGSPPFDAHKTTTVPRVSVPQAGQRYPVWYDPADPDEFAFAISDGSEEAREQIVAVFGDAFGADGSGVGLPVAPPDVDPLTGA
jgi:hypothetical protein